MQLTFYSDYSLRVLLYLSQMPKETATITEISDFYNISKNHLVKVVHRLAQLEFIISTRGKGGGIKLAKRPDEITIGEVVRKTEPHFNLVECFNETTNLCVITNSCRLKGILHQGMEAFFNVLDQYTLAEGSKTALIKQIKNHLDLNSKRSL
ncbi:MAG TPA: Rrf2 family transcriptional regulator [Coxiellaceae bacterium]|nr:Rrf2 family transcriptional regulator [Coxiellaceae bacterium]